MKKELYIPESGSHIIADEFPHFTVLLPFYYLPVARFLLVCYLTDYKRTSGNKQLSNNNQKWHNIYAQKN